MTTDARPARFEPDEPWDRVTIGGQAIPAPCTVSRRTERGYNPAGTFDIRLDVYEKNWGAVQDYLSALDPLRADPRPVEHPLFQFYAVRQIRIQEIENAIPGEDVLGNAIKTVSIVVEEA